MPCPSVAEDKHGRRKPQHRPQPASGTSGKAVTAPGCYRPWACLGLPPLSPAAAAGDVHCSFPFTGVRRAGPATPVQQIPALGLGLTGKSCAFSSLLQGGSKTQSLGAGYNPTCKHQRFVS